MGTVDRDINTFITIPQWILLRTRNVSENKVIEKSKHTFHVQYFFFPDNDIIYEIRCKNIVQPERPRITV
jgi:hypothetical protein